MINAWRSHRKKVLPSHSFPRWNQNMLKLYCPQYRDAIRVCYEGIFGYTVCRKRWNKLADSSIMSMFSRSKHQCTNTTAAGAYCDPIINHFKTVWYSLPTPTSFLSHCTHETFKAICVSEERGKLSCFHRHHSTIFSGLSSRPESLTDARGWKLDATGLAEWNDRVT